MKIRDTKNIQRRQRTPSPNYSSSDDSSSDDNDYYDSNLNLINNEECYDYVFIIFFIIISKLI